MSDFALTSQPNQIVLPVQKLDTGGDIHETMKFDRYNNIYNAHTIPYVFLVTKVSILIGKNRSIA